MMSTLAIQEASILQWRSQDFGKGRAQICWAGPEQALNIAWNFTYKKVPSGSNFSVFRFFSVFRLLILADL